MLKRRIETAGIAHANEYSGHSLRAGFITEARNRTIDESDTMKHTRHHDLTAFRNYDRGADTLSDRNPTTNLTL